jgi:hypothetical protein
VKVYLAGSGSVQCSYVPDLRKRLRSQREPGHEEVEDPADADIVLFSESHLLTSDWRIESFASTPLAKAFHDKIAVYDERDRPWCRYPGIYVSMPRSGFVPLWQVPGSYWNVEPIPDKLGSALVTAEPDLLFSFVGTRTHRCREAIFALRAPRAYIEAVEGFMFWDQASVDYDSRRRTFAEITARSKFVLCPRGHGTASIRLFEVMSAGRVPVIISDEWVPPAGPTWEEFSLRWPESRVADLPRALGDIEHAAALMGSKAYAAFQTWFTPEIAIKRQLDDLEQLLRGRTRERFPRSGCRNVQYFRCLRASVAEPLKQTARRLTGRYAGRPH